MSNDIILPPNSKAILLTRGKFTIVDESDFNWLTQRKWQYNAGYAIQHKYTGFVEGIIKTKRFYMHRLIMATPPGMDTDHINGDKLDNRRCNLRICNRSENKQNSGKQNGKTSSIYKGVSWNNADRKWTAKIKANGNRYWLGYFPNEISAAIAYNEAALKYYGEFARLNLIPFIAMQGGMS